MTGKMQPVESRRGKVGTVWKALQGLACPRCGWRRYSLVFRATAKGGVGQLAARCSHCQALRALEPTEIERDLQLMASGRW
ncbi:hypothetical protein [Candidatus Nitrospira bockiana]